jgi:Cu2+-exporting ATPase
MQSTALEGPPECSVTKIGIETTVSPKAQSARAKTIDLENDAAREHIVYRVSGMTCTSCTKKVFNVLSNIDGVSSVKVTFVTGIAEFDLNPAIIGIEHVAPRIERETGFKFSRIVSTYQSLDVHINPTVTRSTYEELGKLVESIKQVNKTTYHIDYDPTVVGARDLLSSVEGLSLAPPGTEVALAESRKRLWKMSWNTGLATLLTIPIVVLAWSRNPIPYSTKSVVCLVLATFVQAIAVPEFYAGAIKSLLYSRVLEMDMLVVISITVAYGYSVIAFALTHAGYTLKTGEFFETGALLITLVLLGRLVAAIAKVKAISTVSLQSLQAEKAVLIDHTGDMTEIDARLLQFGDMFYVPAHSRIVTDGEVVQGQGAVDESMLTGEIVPVPKAAGDEVIAGTINGPTALNVQMTRLPGKNSITDIANLVENALASKPHIQDLADKMAGYFIPIVIAVSLIVFAIWVTIAMEGRGEGGGGAVGIAITYGIAVLAISCPCALGLAVPMVLVIAGGVAAKSGIIIKQADAIERGYKVTDVVFDKTGTLTKGDLTVVHSQVFDHSHSSANEILGLAKALVNGNTHPVSLAVANHGDVQSAHAAEVDNVQSIPGYGVQCLWRGSNIKAGNPYWLGIEDRLEINTLADRGMTLFCLTLDSTLLAAFGLKSTLRDEAKAVVEHLTRSKIQCHIVSGDGPRVAKDVAQAVGIPIAYTAFSKTPAEKQEYVKALMADNRVVLFCGDGTNDAVAVAQANVGVQIGTTSDITRASADVVLLGGLDGVPTLLELSKRSFRRITFNFVWSAVYNVFAILLASGTFVRVRIPPAYAGLGEIVSVLPVIAVALSLARNRKRA